MPPPPEDKKELHFYPGEHKVIWVVNGKAAIKAEAWGGEVGPNDGTMTPQRTTPGRYVIYSYAPYRTNTWQMSKLAWGTKLRLDDTKKYLMYATGNLRHPWAKLEDKLPFATLKAVKQLYSYYFGPSGKYDSDHDGVPDAWVFNDFGPWAVRYFRDKNKNKKLNLDKGESLSGEMLHTTPDNEGQVARGEPVTLGPSHGCIHLNPIERDQLYKAGAFEKGTEFVVHPYKEKIPEALR